MSFPTRNATSPRSKTLPARLSVSDTLWPRCRVVAHIDIVLIVEKGKSSRPTKTRSWPSLTGEVPLNTKEARMSKLLRYLRYREDSAQAAEIVQGPGSEDQAQKFSMSGHVLKYAMPLQLRARRLNAPALECSHETESVPIVCVLKVSRPSLLGHVCLLRTAPFQPHQTSPWTPQVITHLQGKECLNLEVPVVQILQDNSVVVFGQPVRQRRRLME